MINGEILDPKKVWVKSLHLTLGNFFFGYSIGFLNPCLDNIGYTMGWDSTAKDLYSNLFSTFVPLGALFGASITGLLSNKFGRRATMLVTDFFIFLGSVLSAIPFTAPFGAGRFICGFGVGLALTITPMFVGETTPQALMGKIGPYISLNINLGLVAVFGLGLILPTGNYDGDSLNNFWYFIAAFPGLVALYQAFYIYKLVKYDTPQFYLVQDDLENYEAALAEIFDEKSIQEEINKYKVSENGQQLKTTSTERITYGQLFSTRKFRRMLRIGIILAVLQQFSGVNAIIFYSSTIFQNMGSGVFVSHLIGFLQAVSQVLSNFGTVILMKYYGRRALIVSGQFLMAIVLCILGLTDYFLPGDIAFPGVLTCLYFIIFAYSLSGTLWAYFGEVLNEKVMSISVTFNYLANIIVVLGFPYASDLAGTSLVFYFFGLCMLAGGVYSICDLIETKNKTRDEINDSTKNLIDPKISLANK